PPDEHGWDGPLRQSVFRERDLESPRLHVRTSEHVRPRLPSGDASAVRHGERAELQRRDQPPPGSGRRASELRMGPQRELLRHASAAERYEPGWAESGPTDLVLAHIDLPPERGHLWRAVLPRVPRRPVTGPLQH